MISPRSRTFLDASREQFWTSWDIWELSWSVFGRPGSVLEASWRRPGASWGRLGASWGVLERLDRVLKRKRASAVGGAELCCGPGNTQLSKKKRTTETSTDLYRPLDLYRPPSNARRHAAGRLRARCGSQAQQSCVPATAPKLLLQKIKIKVWRVFCGLNN